MNVLVVGATGATGRLLVEQLLTSGHQVKVIVRSAARMPEQIKDHSQLTIIEASLLDLSDAELKEQVKGVDAIASCLGHNLTFKGVYGHPRRLVTDAVRRLSAAVEANRPAKKVKFVLMNTAGNQNRDLNEPLSVAHRMVVGTLRLILPPHVDNEQAADHLRTEIGRNNPYVEWVTVRPDGLVDLEEVTEYEVHTSPTRDPIFNSGTTSRINVGHFMAQLIVNAELWTQWQGQMPVIYNVEG